MTLVVMSDFDGTIVDIDTAEYILDKFATDEWRIYNRQFEKGEITLEECMQKQFSLVKASKKQILKEVENAAHFRADFQKLAEYCTSHEIPLIVVSAGLDFVIKHILKQKGYDSAVEVVSAKSETTPEGIKLSFPTLRDKASMNFKDDIVRQCKKQSRKVAYIGDGTGDAEALRAADYRFTIAGSELTKLCDNEDIPHIEIKDFQQVIDEIDNISKHETCCAGKS